MQCHNSSAGIFTKFKDSSEDSLLIAPVVPVLPPPVKANLTYITNL